MFPAYGSGILGVTGFLVLVLIVWWLVHGKPQMWDKRHSNPRYNSFKRYMSSIPSRVRNRVRNRTARSVNVPATTVPPPVASTPAPPTEIPASPPNVEVNHVT